MSTTASYPLFAETTAAGRSRAINTPTRSALEQGGGVGGGVMDRARGRTYPLPRRVSIHGYQTSEAGSLAAAANARRRRRSSVGKASHAISASLMMTSEQPAGTSDSKDAGKALSGPITVNNSASSSSASSSTAVSSLSNTFAGPVMPTPMKEANEKDNIGAGASTATRRTSRGHETTFRNSDSAEDIGIESNSTGHKPLLMAKRPAHDPATLNQIITPPVGASSTSLSDTQGSLHPLERAGNSTSTRQPGSVTVTADPNAAAPSITFTYTRAVIPKDVKKGRSQLGARAQFGGMDPMSMGAPQHLSTLNRDDNITHIQHHQQQLQHQNQLLQQQPNGSVGAEQTHQWLNGSTSGMPLNNKAAQLHLLDTSGVAMMMATAASGSTTPVQSPSQFQGN
ncbi:hypothetical protein BGZ58_001959, partial [Dissophora ornata]